MPAIELTFPTSRYHATPWDHHVNEGLVEWPPSPWRLLRTLIATWHTKARDEISVEVMRALAETLSDVLPVYRLPVGAVTAHTRHYMPPYNGNPTKVFDTFMHLPSEAAVRIEWPNVVLTDEQQQALALLCERMTYFGRAESWVQVRTVETLGDTPNAQPVPGGATLAPDEELVRVLAPLPTTEMQRWRRMALDRAITQRLAKKQANAREKGKPIPAKLTPKEIAGAEATLPTDLWQALQVETAGLRKAGWSQPPGSRWVDYACPRADASVAPSRRLHRRTSESLPTVARFAIASAVAPRLTQVVAFAERVRSALLKLSDCAPVFVGRDGDVPLVGHPHAYILPESNGDFGRITHVTIYARMGFDARAQRALERLCELRRRDGNHIQLVLLHVGAPGDIGGTDVRGGQCPLLATSDVWESRTPFVATRHLKLKGGRPLRNERGFVIGGPEHDLLRLLEKEGVGLPDEVVRRPDTILGEKKVRWTAFQNERYRGGGRRGGAAPAGFYLRFATPIQGPIAVGYGAHFGLGVMTPA